jgi:hypothetical protein
MKIIKHQVKTLKCINFKYEQRLSMGQGNNKYRVDIHIRIANNHSSKADSLIRSLGFYEFFIENDQHDQPNAEHDIGVSNAPNV